MRAGTNHHFSTTDKAFIKACKSAGIPATSRQASKFLRGMGLAWKVLSKKIEVIKDDKGNIKIR